MLSLLLYIACGLGWASTQNGGRPVIVGVAPDAGPIGTVITLRGSNFTARNVIQFRGARDFAAGSPARSSDGSTLRAPVTPCPASELQCPTFFVPPGVYRVTVINEDGQSNAVNFIILRQ
jgi:hypothetical protein